jgi:O-acetylserine/cysteine efflux transporter
MAMVGSRDMIRRDFLLVVLVMFIWGVNFSMIRLGVSEVNPLLATAARFTLAIVPMILFIRRPEVKWRYLMAYGVTFGVGVWGMASWSITMGLSSGMSSVLLQTNVLFGVLVGVFLYKESITMAKSLGLGLAFMGLLTSIFSTNGNVTLAGLVLILISAVSWTLIGVIVKTAKVKQAFAFNLWGMLFAPLPLVLLAVLINGVDVLDDAVALWRWDTTYAVLFQAYPTTLFGYWIWNKMLLKYPFSTVAPLTLLTPVFALISGYFAFSERLSLSQLCACGLFLAGIMLVVINPSMPKWLTERRPAPNQP